MTCNYRNKKEEVKLHVDVDDVGEKLCVQLIMQSNSKLQL